MALVNMADMLGHAYRYAYAVGAFGVVTLDFLEAVIQAAENYRAAEVLEQCRILAEARASSDIRASG
ncbi:MAG: class II fructose-bisphosphate aldolase [Sulfurimicrobium sp.]